LKREKETDNFIIEIALLLYSHSWRGPKSCQMPFEESISRETLRGSSLESTTLSRSLDTVGTNQAKKKKKE